MGEHSHRYGQVVTEEEKLTSPHNPPYRQEHHFMTHVVRTRLLTFCLAILPAGIAFAQTQSSEADPAATVAASAVAYVYVGTSKGVYLYDAASSGKLTLVSGSPFKTAGTATGSNGKYFITLGTQYLHSYPVAANGALKAQVSQINTANYAPGDCAVPSGASLDLTGQNVYVLVNPPNEDFVENCAAYQSFSLGKTNGALAFQSVALVDPPLFPLTLTANNQFAIAANPVTNTDGTIDALTYRVFSRQSNGALKTWNIINNLELQDAADGANYFPWLANAGPGNSLAAALGDWLFYESPIVSNGPVVLVSYTVDGDGNISTTNLGSETPTPAVGPTMIKISPSGQLLAVAGNSQVAPAPVLLLANGLQIFHFNGPDPITPYSKVLTSDPIDQMQWDDNDHLFALSDATHKLYVYTVTPTSITAAPGSPYIIASANALVVVPTSSCSAPTSAGVHICSPTSGASVSSPVLVTATSKVTGTIVSTQLWVDGVKNFNSPGSTTLTTSVSLAAGSHRFAVIATNTSGQKWESTVIATVK